MDDRQRLPLRNEDISLKEALLIDEKGTRLGVYKLAELLQGAVFDREKYDLVLVNAEHQPPITRLLPKGLEYRRRRMQEAAEVRQRLQCRLKEVRFATSMAEHDREIRWRKLVDLLRRAFRIKLVVESKGRNGRMPIIKEQLNRSIMERLQVEFGRSLSIISPPEALNGALVTVLYCNMARPRDCLREETHEQ